MYEHESRYLFSIIDFNSFVYIPRSESAESEVVLVLVFGENLHSMFYNCFVSLQGFPFFHIFANTGYFCVFYNYHVTVTPHCCFDLHFPDD